MSQAKKVTLKKAPLSNEELLDFSISAQSEIAQYYANMLNECTDTEIRGCLLGLINTEYVIRETFFTEKQKRFTVEKLIAKPEMIATVKEKFSHISFSQETAELE